MPKLVFALCNLVIFSNISSRHFHVIYQAKWCELPERTVLVITSVKGAQVESFSWML